MTEMDDYVESAEPAERSGWLYFAGLLILIMGIINVFEGIVALWNKKYGAFVGGSYIVFDLRWWGIIHLVLGLVLVATGIGIVYGQDWARGVGIGLAGAAAVIQMLYIVSAPLWALINIGLCVLVIYALVVPGMRHEGAPPIRS